MGKGTTFKIYFPSVDEPVQRWEPTRDEPEFLRGSETILLAEDAEDLRELTSELLTRNGYTVLMAESAKQIIDLAVRYKEQIHLLLTDVVMPGMNGRYLADSLRTTFPDMRVLFMSGYTSDTIVHHGVLEAGIHFVEKPFTEAALLRKLREVLGPNQ